MAEPITIVANPAPDMTQVAALYDAVGWTVYTRDKDRLTRAIHNTSYVVCAWEDDRLVGLARCISDDETIAYIQDILVHPAAQRRGIGRRLVESCLVRYQHVRQKVLLTDDRPEQLAFYKSLGFHNTRDLTDVTLNAFVRFENTTLA